jgi:hypothetical protein
MESMSRRVRGETARTRRATSIPPTPGIESRDHAHVRLLFEEPAHAFAHQRVVVNKHYPDHREER